MEPQIHGETRVLNHPILAHDPIPADVSAYEYCWDTGLCGLPSNHEGNHVEDHPRAECGCAELCVLCVYRARRSLARRNPSAIDIFDVLSDATEIVRNEQRSAHIHDHAARAPRQAPERETATLTTTDIAVLAALAFTTE